jgi:hypothetical protein
VRNVGRKSMTKCIGIRPFSMTFDEYVDAVQWVTENEEAYIHNPEKYHRFRDDTREVLKKAYRRARKP